MKFAFMTLACPKWTWEEILLNGRKMGYDGVELRFIHDVRDLTQSPEMQPNRIAESKRELTDAGLAVACVDTSTSIVTADDKAMDAAMRHIDVASALGSPYVRIFGGTLPKEKGEYDGAMQRAGKRFRDLGEYGKSRNVQPILETHDDFSKSEHVERLIKLAAHDNIGMLWDMHHPARFHGEPIAETYNRIKPWVRHTHIKDSVATANGGCHYKLLGEGDIPVRDCVRVLKESGYKGYLCVEWEKTWHPDIEEPEVALPQYFSELKRMV